MQKYPTFSVNAKANLEIVEAELYELLEIATSTLKALEEQLKCGTKQMRYLDLIRRHLLVTKQLYYALFSKDKFLQNVNHQSIFHINPKLSLTMLREELTEYIYELNSWCYYAAYIILEEDSDSHKINIFSSLYKYTEKMVEIIDFINLNLITYD